MISTEKLENAARKIEETGKLEITFTIEKEAIDKMLVASFKKFARISNVESEAMWLTAWKIIGTYLEMKRNGRL